MPLQLVELIVGDGAAQGQVGDFQVDLRRLFRRLNEAEGMVALRGSRCGP